MPHAIDLIDAQLLKVAAPETAIQLLAPFADPLKLACSQFEIDTVREIACLLGQGAHESGGFQHLDENLNYSAQRLAQVWPKRFAASPDIPNQIAFSIAHHPEQIANIVYANRMGNGPPESGDGWAHRGGGIFQLTGAWNQNLCADELGVARAEFPAYLRTPRGAALSAGWYFHHNNLARRASTPGWTDDSEAVNGGDVGLANRAQRCNAVVAELLRRGA